MSLNLLTSTSANTRGLQRNVAQVADLQLSAGSPDLAQARSSRMSAPPSHQGDLGAAFAIAGNLIAVEAPTDASDPKRGAGVVRVNNLARVTPDEPILTLSEPDPIATKYGFGHSLAFVGRTLAIGAVPLPYGYFGRSPVMLFESGF